MWQQGAALERLPADDVAFYAAFARSSFSPPRLTGTNRVA
jgi:hypothetical protein